MRQITYLCYYTRILYNDTTMIDENKGQVMCTKATAPE